jgi:cystathionine beta-lyase
MKISTLCPRVFAENDPYGAVAPPIYQTATFRQPSAVECGEYDYSRTANPTRSLVEQQIATLEGGRFACAFASGMAAISALTRLVRVGEEILAGDDLYGGTTRLLAKVAPHLGIRVRWVDATDPAAVEREIGPDTRLLLVESPTNPLLRVADLERLAAIARHRRVLLAVDNSLLSPILQRPLALGAHLVVHSATKALCGHGDVLAGAVVTDAPNLHERIAFHLNAEGAGLAPFDSWLLLRGMKTLALRIERQCATARTVASFLIAHPDTRQVFYPGLGPVVSFTTGDPERSRRLVEAARLFTIAVSFGSVTSSISLPCHMSHASVPAELRDRLAPPADLVRLSVGIEDEDDLLDDLRQAFGVAASGVRSLSAPPAGTRSEVFAAPASCTPD